MATLPITLDVDATNVTPIDKYSESAKEAANETPTRRVRGPIKSSHLALELEIDPSTVRNYVRKLTHAMHPAFTKRRHGRPLNEAQIEAVTFMSDSSASGYRGKDLIKRVLKAYSTFDIERLQLKEICDRHDAAPELYAALEQFILSLLRKP